jgi:hypothetical protein
VDAGHFQVEMDFANLTYNRPNRERGNVRFTSVEIAPMNVKPGCNRPIARILFVVPLVDADQTRA